MRHLHGFIVLFISAFMIVGLTKTAAADAFGIATLAWAQYSGGGGDNCGSGYVYTPSATCSVGTALDDGLGSVNSIFTANAAVGKLGVSAGAAASMVEYPAYYALDTQGGAWAAFWDTLVVHASSAFSGSVDVLVQMHGSVGASASGAAYGDANARAYLGGDWPFSGPNGTLLFNRWVDSSGLVYETGSDMVHVFLPLWVTTFDGGTGQWYGSSTLHLTLAGTAYCGAGIPDGGGCLASVDYGNTLDVIGATVLDANGNPVSGVTLQGASGFDYHGAAEVPEPATLVLLLGGLGPAARYLRRRS